MSELSVVALAYQISHRDLNDAEVSKMTGIQPKNIPRSRIKLWFMGYLETSDYISFRISSAGSHEVMDDIKFSDDFMEAISKFRKAKVAHKRGSHQQVLFDED
jgi:hypothetical protein